MYNGPTIVREADVAAKRKRYTPEKRQEILADAASTSMSAAAKKHGVSIGSIINWKGASKPSHQRSTKADRPLGSGILSRLAALEDRVSKIEQILI